MNITQESLKDRLHYDAKTGVFRWLACHCPTVSDGQVAGWDNGKNAWRINIDGRCYLAHRLAWFYVYGTWPPQIDHINGNRRDNRIINLRPADNSQNQANVRAKKNNRLGVRGVGFKSGRYVVQLRKGSQKVRASFKTLEEASEFASEKSKLLHGEFSIHNRRSL